MNLSVIVLDDIGAREGFVAGGGGALSTVAGTGPGARLLIRGPALRSRDGVVLAISHDATRSIRYGSWYSPAATGPWTRVRFGGGFFGDGGG